MIAKKENFDKKVSDKKVEDITLEAAAEIVDATMKEIEPTTADEFNKEYLKEEVDEIEKELKKNLDTLGRTVQQLMIKMDDMNQNTINLKHRIQVLETRVGVIH